MGFFNLLGEIIEEAAQEGMKQFTSSLQEELRKQREEEYQQALEVANGIRDFLKEIYEVLMEVKLEACKSGNVEELLIPSIRIAAFCGNDLELFWIFEREEILDGSVIRSKYKKFEVRYLHRKNGRK